MLCAVNQIKISGKDIVCTFSVMVFLMLDLLYFTRL